METHLGTSLGIKVIKLVYLVNITLPKSWVLREDFLYLEKAQVIKPPISGIEYIFSINMTRYINWKISIYFQSHF